MTVPIHFRGVDLDRVEVIRDCPPMFALDQALTFASLPPAYVQPPQDIPPVPLPASGLLLALALGLLWRMK